MNMSAVELCLVGSDWLSLMVETRVRGEGGGWALRYGNVRFGSTYLFFAAFWNEERSTALPIRCSWLPCGPPPSSSS